MKKYKIKLPTDEQIEKEIQKEWKARALRIIGKEYDNSANQYTNTKVYNEIRDKVIAKYSYSYSKKGCEMFAKHRIFEVPKNFLSGEEVDGDFTDDPIAFSVKGKIVGFGRMKKIRGHWFVTEFTELKIDKKKSMKTLQWKLINEFKIPYEECDTIYKRYQIIRSGKYKIKFMKSPTIKKK